MNERTERFSPYSKRELAAMYFPYVLNEQSAVKRLNRMIHRVPELVKELEKVNYNPRSRSFTSWQVGLLFHYLGQP